MVLQEALDLRGPAVSDGCNGYILQCQIKYHHCRTEFDDHACVHSRVVTFEQWCRGVVLLPGVFSSCSTKYLGFFAMVEHWHVLRKRQHRATSMLFA